MDKTTLTGTLPGAKAAGQRGGGGGQGGQQPLGSHTHIVSPMGQKERGRSTDWKFSRDKQTLPLLPTSREKTSFWLGDHPAEKVSFSQ